MLSKEDNEFACRVGPGTPMGELFRRFWLPAMLPEWPNDRLGLAYWLTDPRNPLTSRSDLQLATREF